MHRVVTTIALVAILVCAAPLTAQTCPTPTITQLGVTGPVCPGDLVGLDAGTGSSFTWSNGEKTQQIWFTATATTTFTVTVTDANGCIATSAPYELQVKAPTAPEPQVTWSPTQVCPGPWSPAGPVPHASVVNSGDYTGVEWSIRNGQFTTPSNSPSVDFVATGLDPVELTATATQPNGCKVAKTITIPIRTLEAPPIEIGPETAICPNGGQLTASAAPGISYHGYGWQIRNGRFVSPFDQPSVSFTSTSATDPVELTLTVVDAAGCTLTSTRTVPFRAAEKPIIEWGGGPGSCPNGYPLSAQVQASQNYATFNWTITNGEFTTAPNQSSVSFRATGTSPVVLSVMVTNYAGCAAASDPVTVPIATLAKPIIEWGGGPGSCPNGYPLSAQVQASQNYATFSWSITNGEFTTGSTQASVSFRATGTLPVVLSVAVTNYAGCVAASDPVTVPIATLAKPIIEWGGGPGSCPNGYPLSAQVQASQNYATFNWTITNGELTTASNQSSVSFRATGTSPVVLSVTVTNYAGCVAASDPVTVPIATLTKPIIEWGGGPGSCPNGYPLSAQVQTSQNYATFNWTIANGEFTTASDQSSVSFRASGNSPVALSVTVTNYAGCSATSDTVQVPIATLAAPEVTWSPYAVTASGGTGSASVGNPGNYASYSWSITGGTITSSSTASDVQFQSSGTDPVQLTVVVTSYAGCVATTSVTVPIRGDAPMIEVTPLSVCPNGSTGTAQVTGPVSYVSYEWTVTNGERLFASDPSQVTFRATSTDPVQLSVRLTDASGTVTNLSTTVPIRTLAPPLINSYQETTGICTNGSTGSASVDTSGPNSYATFSWTIANGVFTSATNQQWVDFQATTTDPVVLTVIVTDQRGCTATASKTIPIRTIQPPVIHSYQETTGVCVNGSTGSAAVDVSSPNDYATFAWTIANGVFTSATNQQWVDFQATTTSPVELSVIVTDQRGCTATASKTIPIRTIQPPVIHSYQETTGVCVNGSPGSAAVDVSSPNDYTTFAWTISNGVFTSATNQQWVDFQATTTNPVMLTVTVTDQRGCTATASKTIPIRTIQPPVIHSYQETTGVCINGATGSAAVDVSSPNDYATFAWTISNGVFTSATNQQWVDFRATTSNPVLLTVTVTDQRGCTATATKSIPIRTISAPAINAPSTLCKGAPGHASTSGMVTYASYLWTIRNGGITGPANGSSVDFYPTGADTVELSVTVTDDRGCGATATSSVPIRIQAQPIVTVEGGSTCSPYGVTLAASPGYGSYQWSNGATGEQIVVHEAGTYSVTATGLYGCTSSSEPVTITGGAPTPVVTASGPTTFCSGGSVTLTAPESAQYSWTNGATTRSITVSESGSYAVTITAGGGCTATSAPIAVTVTQPSSTPTITASGATTFCRGGSVTLTSSAASSNLWSNGATTQSITVTTSGSYSVTVTDGSGCSATSSPTVVTVNDGPSTGIVSSGPTTFCKGGSVTLNATATSGTYLWSTGATTQSIAVTDTGTYRVTVTDGSGCSSSASQVVTVLDASAAITPAGAVNACAGQSVTLTASPGASYLWSTGETTQSISVTAAGSYSVTVMNLDGCPATSAPTAVSFTTPAAPVISVTPPQACDTTLTVHAAVSNASAYASFSWRSNGYIQSFGQDFSTAEITPVYTTGTFWIEAEAVTAAGCHATTRVEVPQTPVPDATITSPDTVCELVDVRSYVADAGPGATYDWSVLGGTITSGINTPSIHWTPHYLNDGKSNIWVEVKTAAGCSKQAIKYFTVNHSPDASITVSAAEPLCAHAAYTATTPDAGPGVTYRWTIGNGRIVSGAESNSIQFEPDPMGTGTTYLAVYVTAPNGCTVTVPRALRVNPSPGGRIDITAGQLQFCEGGSVTFNAFGTDDVVAYRWSTGETTRSITVTQSGSYSLTVISSNGCSSVTPAETVTVYPKPDATITASGPTTFCPGGSVTLTASPADSYQWNTGATTQSITVTQAGSYFVTERANYGCSKTSAATTVTVVQPPQPAITASGPTTFCQGGSVTLTAPSGMASYAWSNGAITQAITVAAAGSYSVTVTDLTGCSGTSQPVTVSVLPLPQADIILTDTFYNASPATPGSKLTQQANYVSHDGNVYTYCGSVNAKLHVDPVVGATYLWSTGATGIGIDVTQAGTYSVTVTSAEGCSSSTSVVIQVNPSPTATITANGPTEICPGTGSVTLTAGGGDSYRWSTGATTESIVATAAGTYSVTATRNGCSNTASIDVTNPEVTVSASGPTAFCAGGSVTLTSSPAASYLWSNGATTQAVTVTAAGSYSVTAGTASGCTIASAPVTVTTGPMAVTVTPTTAEKVCPGGDVSFHADVTGGSSFTYQWYDANGTPIPGATGPDYTLHNVPAGASHVTVKVVEGECSITGGASYYTDPYSLTINPNGPTTFCEGQSVTLTASDARAVWSTGETGSSIVVRQSGTYSFSVTPTSGCTATASPVTVNVLPLPRPTVEASGPTTFCAGGSVSLTLTSSPGASVSWSTGATTSSIVVTQSGEYRVSVLGENGCVGQSDPVTVTVNPLPAATITPSGPTTFCEGGSVILTASAGTSYLWSNGAISQSITVTQPGSYDVTVANGSGCSAKSAPLSVAVNPLPAPVITASGPTTFCAGGSVTLTSSSGPSYLWSNGATTQSITVSRTDSYTVTVTNANGCSAVSAPVAVKVNALPAPTITAGGPTTFCSGGSVTLTASAADSYLWSNGATTQSITVSTSDSYSVTVSDASGCSGTSAPTSVTVNPLPSAVITPSGPTTFCEGGSVTLSAPSGMTSYLWSTGAPTQSITVTSSGSYAVTITNANGCSSSAPPVVVTVNPNPQTPAITASGPTTFCPGSSVTLTAPAGYSYQWNTGQTTQSIVATQSGSYTVTVTNAGGCQAISMPVTVTVTAPTAINSQPASQTITRNTATTLSVVASGTGTLSYQWFTGTTGDTSHQIGGATSSSYTTPKLTKGTYNYWVRVTAGCGSVNSDTAVIKAQ